MTNYQIIGDSCCDYAYDIDLSWLRRVPLTIELEGVQYLDTAELDCQALLKKMAAAALAPHSACPSIGHWLEAFGCGAQNIYVVTLSGALSGSYNSAVIAAGEYTAAHPDVRIHVFNSRSAACGEIDICLKLHELAEQGVEFDEMVETVEAFIDGMHTLFTLETLDVFRKNGRLNHLASLATAALKIKVVMRGDPDGNISPVVKALTMQHALSRMTAHIKTLTDKCGAEGRRLVITHCNCPDRAVKVRDAILAECPFESAVICRSGGISTIYANDGGIIVSF